MTDQLDYQILDALQLHPRIAWTDLAAILAVDASTLSRRWMRLTDDGLVASSCFRREPTGARSGAGAFVHVSCAPAQRNSVIDRLVTEASVVSVHCVTGRSDLILTLNYPNVLQLDHYVHGTIARIPGVVAIETHNIRGIFQDASDWDYSTLSDSQRSTILANRRRVPSDQQPTPFLDEVIDAIGDNVRRPVQDIQRIVGRTFRTVSRAVDVLLVAPWARWRIDIAHHQFGWYEVIVWLNVPEALVEELAAFVRAIPTVRLTASVVSRANIVCTLWAQDLEEIFRAERLIQRRFPRVRVEDRSLVPHIAKRMGHVINEEGRFSGYVPYQPPAAAHPDGWP